MSYGEYKNSGRCGGKVLWQLSQLNLPFVDTVIFVGEGQLTLHGEPYANYVWNEEDIPIFSFFNSRLREIKQPELFTAYYQNEISHATVKLFHFTNPANFPMMSTNESFRVSFVTNKEGKQVDTVNFKPIVHKIGGQNSMEAKADALRQAFCTPKRTKR